MTPYFDTPECQAELVRIARAWIGTPFHPHARIRGAGVDCVQLLGQIYAEAGALHGAPEFGGYTMDGGEHRGTSQVLDWLDACPRFARVQLPAPPAFAVGDLLAFRLGRVAHHVGLGTGRQTFIHAMRNYGVIESRLDDPTFAKRFVALYRPVR